MIVRTATAALLLLAGCSPPPARNEHARSDPTTEPAYAQAVEQLAVLNREADDLLKSHRPDAAAAAITKGQPLQDRLLAAPHPTLAAMEAVSDRDDRYARMLLANGNTGWARMLFQKNVSRWKNWTPRTADSARRLEAAQAGLSDCDRRLQQ